MAATVGVLYTVAMEGRYLPPYHRLLVTTPGTPPAGFLDKKIAIAIEAWEAYRKLGLRGWEDKVSRPTWPSQPRLYFLVVDSATFHLHSASILQEISAALYNLQDQ